MIFKNNNGGLRLDLNVHSSVLVAKAEATAEVEDLKSKTDFKNDQQFIETDWSGLVSLSKMNEL